MKNRKNYLFPSLMVLLAIIVALGAYKLSYILGENYFFDKLFFQKSAKHGYLNCQNDCQFEKYGIRSEGIIKILSFSINRSSQTKVLGEKTDDTYTIAVIGDSYVWGTGVKEDETLSLFLEKKLNKIKKTKVIQLGFAGDSALDNLIKYQLIDREQNVDLYIFVIVENDLLFFPYSKYDQEYSKEIISSCTSSNDQIAYNYNEETPGYDYSRLVEESFGNPQNLCVLDKIVSLYPKNAIYFIPLWKGHEFDKYFEIYSDYLKRENLTVIAVDEAINFPKYQKYWQDPFRYFKVSKNELHPSKIAHQMFADILFEEITTNPKWGF